MTVGFESGPVLRHLDQTFSFTALCVDTASIWIMLCIHKKGPSWVLRDPTQCNDGILTHRAKQLIGVVRLTINWSSLHVGSPFARTELKRGFDTWDLIEM